MNNKEKTLDEIIMNGECSVGDVQLYMNAHKLDKLALSNGMEISRDKIGKLCVKIYDEAEGTCDLMGLDMFMAINKSNQQVDKKFNTKKLLFEVLWAIVMLTVIIQLNFSIMMCVAFLLGDLFGVVLIFMDKVFDDDKKTVNKG